MKSRPNHKRNPVRLLRSVVLCTLFAVVLVGLYSSFPVTKPDAVHQVRVSETYGKLPMSFEANAGQTDPQVEFLSRGNGYSLFLTPTEAVFALRRAEDHSKVEAGPSKHLPTRKEEQNKQTVLDMQLVGANPEPNIIGQEELPGKSNYFIGNDPQKWHANAPTYAKVKYESVYPGIDLIYHVNPQQLEYDFVLAPGADPNAIQLRFAGATKIEIDSEGDLVLHIGGGEIHQHKPRIYQDIDGVRRHVDGAYVFSSKSKQQVGFHVAAYDQNSALLIDPVLSYSTYMGGSASDWSYAIAVDASGNAYVTGPTYSADFPTLNPVQPAKGSQDAFILKLSADGGSLLYSTYIGGSGLDTGLAIVVDAFGSAYVTGQTDSQDFPVANAVQPAHSGLDAFVIKLNPSGSSIVYSTYLGGYGTEAGSGIAVDDAGSAYVTGWTSSPDFPTVNPLQGQKRGTTDAFVSKLVPSGTALVYSTYLGGSSNDDGTGIAVDGLKRAYVAGETLSTDFPTVHPIQTSNGGQQDAFVVRLNAAGTALEYATYLGGSVYENVGGIAVDTAGNAYIAGDTLSSNFPTRNPVQGTNAGTIDAFITKIDASGTELAYSTYLGGGGWDSAYDVAVDGAGNAYVTGYTVSTNFPTVDAFQTDRSQEDAFVVELNAAGSSLVYASYLGGYGQDFGRDIAVDGSGAAYITGSTDSTDFPRTNPLQPTLRNSVDAFVAKVIQASSTMADLALDIADSPDPVTAGSNLTYALTVNNNGPDTATRVQMTDSLPSGVSLVNASPSQGTCAGSNVIVCDLGPVSSGASAIDSCITNVLSEA